MMFHRVQPFEVSAVLTLLADNGWRDRIGDVSQFQALIAASQVADVAVVGGQVVGFARGITDGLSNGYLSMVVVAQSHRGQGIGRRLVGHVVGSNPKVTWVLRAGRTGALQDRCRTARRGTQGHLARVRTPVSLRGQGNGVGPQERDGR